MSYTESDSSQNTTESHKTAVREYLRSHDEVASKQDLRAGTDVPAWYITQIAAQDTFYTSLNHNSKYVVSKHVVGRRSTHDGFWRPEVDDGEAVFHRKETTKATLKHLAFRRPSGLTAPEAYDLLGRRCYRPLQELAEQGEVHAAECHDTTVYAHRIGITAGWHLGNRRFPTTRRKRSRFRDSQRFACSTVVRAVSPHENRLLTANHNIPTAVGNPRPQPRRERAEVGRGGCQERALENRLLAAVIVVAAISGSVGVVVVLTALVTALVGV